MQKKCGTELENLLNRRGREKWLRQASKI